MIPYIYKNWAKLWNKVFYPMKGSKNADRADCEA